MTEHRLRVSETFLCGALVLSMTGLQRLVFCLRSYLAPYFIGTQLPGSGESYIEEDSWSVLSADHDYCPIRLTKFNLRFDSRTFRLYSIMALDCYCGLLVQISLSVTR